METKNKKETLSDTVSRKLEDMITTQMKAGDRLPTEMVLAEMYSVGRSTIRESLKALSSKGLIVRKKDGTFVSDRVKDCLIAPLDLLITMDIGQINDLIELREMLEVSMIAAAVERATDEDIKNMERILWKCRIRTCRQMNPGNWISSCIVRLQRQQAIPLLRSLLRQCSW